MPMMPYAAWTVSQFAVVASESNTHQEKYVRNRGCVAHANRLVGRRGDRSTRATGVTSVARGATMRTTAAVVLLVVASGGPGRGRILDLDTGVVAATAEA